MNKNILKSIGAIVVGFIAVVVLSTGMDALLEKIGFFPPIGQGPLSDGLLAIALLYRSIFTVLGGYIMARLAPEKPMRLVVIGGIIGTVAGIGGAIAGWNLSAHWYPISIAVLGFPLTWIGGKLRMRNL